MNGNCGGMSAPEEVLGLCRTAVRETMGGPYADRAVEIQARLEGPLRVAIAGRVKAGKSTLLNALVGVRLAPTDAGECTKLVSWYQRAPGYEVNARLPGGGTRPVPFHRRDGSLDVELGDVDPSQVERLEIGWPASTLAELTLIDTPGLASVNDENSRRTRDFLEHEQGHTSDADAVIYLMRHLHQRDVEFLDAFMDRSVAAASPVNTVAVLSRADEIGAGRLDALDSAGRIAARYRDHETVRSLTGAVIPMAGLLAETGLTLREDEVAALRQLVAMEETALERLLLSADHFCDLDASPLTVELRRNLLGRLGLYGLRLSIDALRSRRASTASDLSALLVERSGLVDLRRLIADHFLPRARILQARTALANLRHLAAQLRSDAPASAEQIDREAERIEAGSVQFGQIRAAHLVVSETAKMGDEERAEVQRVVLASSRTVALGLPEDADPDRQKAVALSGIERWRARAGDPLAEPAVLEVCETMARSYEGLYVAAVPAAV